MDIKNDLITAYVAGYEAAKYDLDKDGLWEDIKDMVKDARRWLGLMFKTGVYGRY